MANAFSCPDCQTRLPLKHVWWFNPNRELKCLGCGQTLIVEKTGKWWFAIGFWSVGITGQVAFYLGRPFGEAILGGLLVGVVVYLAAVYYTYKKIRLVVKP